MFWTLSCFNCTEACSTPPTDKNILGNPGFDQFNDSVVPWTASTNSRSGAISVLVSPGYKSSQALQVHQGSLEGHEFYQRFNACPKGTYLASFCIRALTQANSTSPLISVGVAVVGFSRTITSDTWTEIKFYVDEASSDGPNSEYFDITYVLFREAETLSQFDQFSLVRTEPVASSSPSIVSNGGFEHGISPWKSYPPNDPTKKVKLCHVSDDGFESPHSLECNHGYLQQDVPTTPNTTYILNFDYKATYDSLYCHFGYQWGFFSYNGEYIKQNDTWLHLKRALYATSHNTSLIFELKNYPSNVDCTYYFDNISLVKAR